MGQARSRRKLNIVLLGLEEVREKGMGPLLNFKFEMMGRPLGDFIQRRRTELRALDDVALVRGR